MAKRHAKHHGLLVIDKEKGVTSHDVIATARKKFDQRRIGHCGTLDPMATGILLLLFGEATKLANYLMCDPKTYVAQLCLGKETDTLDAEGKVLSTSSVPTIDCASVDRAAGTFLPSYTQTPPAYSAIKVQGTPLYKRARQGETFSIESRKAKLYSFRLLSLQENLLDFEIEVGKGFYVRSFGRDLAEKLGTVGHLTSLRRTATSGFGEKDFDALDPASLRPIESLPWPHIQVDAKEEAKLCMGQRLAPRADFNQIDHGLALSENGKPVAIVEGSERCIRSLRGFRFSDS